MLIRVFINAIRFFKIRSRQHLPWSFCLLWFLVIRNSFKFGITEKIENVYYFTKVVRGFHYYRKFWIPIENEKLNCLHEDNNPYDWFAIKAVTSNGDIVGHLPRQISRVTDFFLDRGTVIQVELISKYYCRSSLVEGGMEIAYLVTVKMPATFKNS